MAEIPPHLLARSKARRASMDGDEAPADAPAATPAKVEAAPAAKAAAPAAAAPAPAAPAPRPMIGELPAGRRRVPVYVMPVLVMILPFAFFYAQGFQTPTVVLQETPLEMGKRLYSEKGCGGCHGPTGAGNSGPKLSEGEVELTFPDEADHAAWIKSGSAAFAGQGYGNPERPGGQRVATGGMPAFASLTDEEVEALVLYEREAL